MDRFRRAVLTEMCYLRDQGGHEVHITNGALVGRHAAGCMPRALDEVVPRAR